MLVCEEGMWYFGVVEVVSIFDSFKLISFGFKLKCCILNFLEIRW